MTDTKSQTEPTMEEILASIRRIISENDEEQEAKKRAESATAPPGVLVPPGAASEEMVAAEAPAAAAAAPVKAPVTPSPAAVRTDAAVLELTDMIAEDGTVISLSTGKPYHQAMPDKARQTLAEDVASEAADQPSKKTAPRPGTAQNSENTMENPKDNTAKQDGLVSASTAAAATATFAQLARSMAQDPQSNNNLAIGSGATIEDIVREMLRPMLKDWLDENLPKMVEHMVRRELDRMVRRAEDV